MALFRPNFGGDLLLAADGVDAHEGSMKVEQFQELGNSRNFVGFFVYGNLAQAQMVLRRPSTHQVQRAKVSRPGTTDRFSVDGNLWDANGSSEGQHPFSETALEHHGIEAFKDSFKRIVARDALGQCKESFEPVMPLAAKGSDLGPTVAARDDAANGDDYDVQEKMASAMSAARVFESAEVFFDGQGSGGQKVPPG